MSLESVSKHGKWYGRWRFRSGAKTLLWRRCPLLNVPTREVLVAALPASHAGVPRLRRHVVVVGPLARLDELPQAKLFH